MRRLGVQTSLARQRRGPVSPSPSHVGLSGSSTAQQIPTGRKLSPKCRQNFSAAATKWGGEVEVSSAGRVRSRQHRGYRGVDIKIRPDLWFSSAWAANTRWRGRSFVNVFKEIWMWKVSHDNFFIVFLHFSHSLLILTLMSDPRLAWPRLSLLTTLLMTLSATSAFQARGFGPFFSPGYELDHHRAHHSHQGYQGYNNYHGYHVHYAPGHRAYRSLLYRSLPERLCVQQQTTISFIWKMLNMWCW